MKLSGVKWFKVIFTINQKYLRDSFFLRPSHPSVSITYKSYMFYLFIKPIYLAIQQTNSESGWCTTELNQLKNTLKSKNQIKIDNNRQGYVKNNSLVHLSNGVSRPVNVTRSWGTSGSSTMTGPTSGGRRFYSIDAAEEKAYYLGPTKCRSLGDNPIIWPLWWIWKDRQIKPGKGTLANNPVPWHEGL